MMPWNALGSSPYYALAASWRICRLSGIKVKCRCEGPETPGCAALTAGGAGNKGEGGGYGSTDLNQPLGASKMVQMRAAEKSLGSGC